MSRLTGQRKLATNSTPGKATKPKCSIDEITNNETEIEKSKTKVQSMKLGIIYPDLPGHLNPMSVLARQLQARNHEVVSFIRRVPAGYPLFLAPRRITLTKTDRK
jgi:hypothetical protein